MRADPAFRTIFNFRLLLTLLLASSLVACKTEKDPDDPTIIGVPPAEAFLGVEYYYNFGAYGGEAILDYTLTNAPSWLALEDTSNKARQGIIMRGVPGLSGGSRGEADLGRQPGINLVTTDGGMSGIQPFDIEVKYNALSLEAPAYTEGDSEANGAEQDDAHCEVPDLTQTGQHQFTVNQYNEDGSKSGEKTITADTHPVLVRLTFDQPSVTRVTVAFELSSQYNPNNCDSGATPPNQRCDHSESNAEYATIGQDLVALGSDSESLLDPVGYITYQQNASGVYTGGVITLEPGITECYIRLEVIEDAFPEEQETARLALTEVRSGLAGLGPNNDGADVSVKIDDNEPLITLQTIRGSRRDALNVGAAREYRAVLTGERNGITRARLKHTKTSNAEIGSEVITERWVNNDWEPADELEFPADLNEVRFRILVPDSSYSNPDMDDRFLLLGLDQEYQAGRENFARAERDSILRVSLNQQISALAVDSSGGFVATDIAVGHAGRIFVAGYDRTDNDRVRVRIYDQKSNLLQDIGISALGDALYRPRPVIDTVKREVTENDSRVDRFEFAVAYHTDAPVAGTTALGGEDVIVTRYRFDEDVNGGTYVWNWTTRTGTSADDRVRSIDLNADSGYVLIAGETQGTWPGQSNAGGIDSFLQRIDTELDGANEVPRLAWTRQVGSTANDSVVAGAARSVAPLLFGSVAGAVNGEPVLGGVDAYFFSTTSGSRGLAVYQVGTDQDDPLTDGGYEENQMWLLGNSAGAYSAPEDEDGNRSLERTGLGSQAGFLLAYTPTGLVNRAYTLNDPDDNATERFESVMAFAGDMIASGATDGVFKAGTINAAGEQGILARVSMVRDDAVAGAGSDSDPAADDQPYRNEWRSQLAVGDSEILSLANYRDDEIHALARTGSNWLVLVFSPEGELLSALN